MISVSTLPATSVPIPHTPPSSSPPPDQPSPALSDDSIFNLSFSYERNEKGEWVRVSKGSSKSSPPSSSEQPSPTSADSPLPTARRASLSRSESVPLVAESASSARSFQRVQSGPISFALASTPASSSIRTLPSSSGLTGTARKIGGPRRVKLDDTNDQFKHEPIPEQRELKLSHEKENADSFHPLSSSSASAKPLAELLPVPQRSINPLPRQVIPVPSRVAGRLVKKVETIAEAEDAEDELGSRPSYMSLPASTTGIRPRRSASLSEANPDNIPPPQFHHFPRLGGPSKGARRVTLEEKLRQERENALEEGYARREAEEAAEVERRAQAIAEAQVAAQQYARKTPSPTHPSSASLLRPAYNSHQRKDSDTLRSTTPAASSPTIMENPGRISPPTRGSYLSSTMTGSSQQAAAIASQAASIPLPSARHRRSPTAPEPPTTSGMIAPPGLSGANFAGKTWAAGDGMSQGQYLDVVDQGMMDDDMPLPTPTLVDAPQPPLPLQQQQKNMGMPPPPLPVKQVQSAPAPIQSNMQNAPDVRARNMIVNKKAYARLDMIGKGGSSRVYRVMNGTNEIFAIKRVSLDKTDAETMSGYMNEIALLKRLEGNSRIIRLVDSEVKAGPGGSKGHLMLVMECGEIDLARLLQEQQREAMDLVWISYYWKQMLQAVHVIHEEKIVHSDLKPANFVLVKGQLKLIDFGIANAIANDTTNIQRDHQIGTVNYMSPEAIELPDGMRRLKVGRPSDVWSLGCILYQMVYGHPPFQHLSVLHKMKAIPDGTHEIDFPEYAIPSIPGSRSGGSASPPKKLDHLKVKVPSSVIDTIKGCLVRNPKQRATIPELLAQDWLLMREEPAPQPTPAAPQLKADETIINPHFMLQLLKYGISLGQQQNPMDGDDLVKEAERLVQELKSVNAQSAPS